MTPIQSILLPLDGSPTAARGLPCALWLAQRLGASLHVLWSTPKPLPEHDALSLLGVAEADRSKVTLHQPVAAPAQALLDAVSAHHIGLVVMSARGGSSADDVDLGKLVGHVARGVIEDSPVPVLLLPRGYRDPLPWTSMLVPTSGEAPADAAIVAALQLGHALGLRVRVAHCADHARGATSDPGLSGYADAPHHEYPQRLHEMIDRAVAGCTNEECACLAEVMLCRGEVEREIVELIERHRVDVLVLGWHGSLASGHASRVKHLLATVHCAVLFVKPPAGAHFVLRVGDALEGASPPSDAGR